MKTPLPADFLERMKRQLDQELLSFLCALEGEPVRGIRMNPRKSFCLPPEAEENVPWEKNGWILPVNSRAGTTIEHEAGAFYLQEPAAMLPARMMDARPGETILDLCAAPGGKSTQMGTDLNGEGLLVCNEPVPKRAQVLSRNIERMGIPNALVLSAQPAQLAKRWPGRFDGVLVDAPCSGEGMFRRDPQTRLEWSVSQAEGCVLRQREILSAAAELVRPGGRLVYSTCTWNPAENEENVCWFLREHPSFQAEPFDLPGVDGQAGMYTCFPHRIRGEGQFAAKLRKRGDQSPEGWQERADSQVSREELMTFSRQFSGWPLPDRRLGQTLVRLGVSMDLSGLKIYRAGLHLAEIRGKTLIPDHAAAVSFLPVSTPQTEVDRSDALRYLSGAVLSGEQNGWCRIVWNGLSLGWAKGSEGQLKNHYPKALRNHLLT